MRNNNELHEKDVRYTYHGFRFIAEWNSEDDIATARPKMIAFLDTLRHTLEELSSDLGVTDPHSGTVIVEK